jgi:hypothetical protein
MDGKFPLGQTVITPNAAGRLNPQDICRCLSRHKRGDWGELCPQDVAQNERSLQEGRLVSVYHDLTGTKFYIITEPDRSVTTVLLPEDY